MISEGRMPHLGSLVESGSLVQMQSVLPTVSSVAWASITTGCGPGKHGIYGFVDREPSTHEMYIPTARNLAVQTWLDLLSATGMRVFSMGVPSTYPPRPVNGIVVGGFLAPNIQKATYPAKVGEELARSGYKIDIDGWQARENREHFLDEVFASLECRLSAMFSFLAREPWDLFVSHVIETDRFHHFLGGYVIDGSEAYTPWFNRLYSRIDQAIGELLDRLDTGTVLMVLSDHGFCKLRQEVHLNAWLRQFGYLAPAAEMPVQVRDLAPSTRCYSLLPGRLYVNLRGRERQGCVSPGREYESVRQDVAAGLLALRDPETGDRVVDAVYMREEVFQGHAAGHAPDMVARPFPGYDLKGTFDCDVVMERSPVNGTHTFDDAMLCLNRQGLSGEGAVLVDVLPTLFTAMGLPVPEDLDGRSLLA